MNGTIIDLNELMEATVVSLTVKAPSSFQVDERLQTSTKFTSRSSSGDIMRTKSAQISIITSSVS